MENTENNLENMEDEHGGGQENNFPTNFTAKKSLGQNFLHAPHIVGKMVHAARIEAGTKVLEVGPGKGVLTRGLLDAGASVLAVEKDDRAIDFIKEKFSQEIVDGKLTLIHGDILEMDFENVKNSQKIENYVVVANIPYYITGELLRKFLESENPPKRMVLMLQKEVAQRIVAKNGQKDNKESILSISVKVFAEPKYIETVPARHFRPVPNVDSAVILIDNISNQRLSEAKIDKKAFFEAVKTGFAHKRKVLIGNLEALNGSSDLTGGPTDRATFRETLKKVWIDCNLDEKVRAEDISVEKWINIVSSLFFHRK